MILYDENNTVIYEPNFERARIAKLELVFSHMDDTQHHLVEVDPYTSPTRRRNSQATQVARTSILALDRMKVCGIGRQSKEYTTYGSLDYSEDSRTPQLHPGVLKIGAMAVMINGEDRMLLGKLSHASVLSQETA